MASHTTVQLEQSSSVLRSVKYQLQHQFTVEDFSLLFARPTNGEAVPFVTSGPFAPSQDQRLQFVIVICPKGDIDTTPDHIGICIRSVFTEQLSVTVKFNLSITDGQYKQEGIASFDEDASWGWDKFISHENLLNSEGELLPEDKLTVNCEIEILANRTTDESTSMVESQMKSLAIEKTLQNYEALLNSGKMSDIVLIVDGKELKLHKNILAAHSSVFEAMFDADMKEKRESRAKIADIKGEVFEEMLRFIYTGTVSQIEKYAEELLPAADMYDIATLKHICEQILCAKVAIGNAANLLYIADLHDASKLKDICLEFIRRHIFEVMLTEDWSKVAVLLGVEMRQLEMSKQQQPITPLKTPKRKARRKIN